MNKIITFTALAGGLLLFLVPRYILPACEYQGYQPMHCSDTAKAEYLTGALLMLLGSATFFLKSTRALVFSSSAAVVLFAVSFYLPDTFGYCHNSRMPCNYGMVPGIRFVAAGGALIMFGVAISLAIKYFKKGKS